MISTILYISICVIVNIICFYLPLDFSDIHVIH